MHGFKVDDIVTTQDGPDADGPWRGMGMGAVKGPSSQKGFLTVYFRESRETFSIKASSLRNHTDVSRSGRYNRPVEIKQEVKRCGGRQQSTKATFSCMNDGKGIPAKEPTTWTFRDGLEAAGLEIGDLVGANIGGHRYETMGTIVGEGANPC